jgi:hypothetical protein
VQIVVGNLPDGRLGVTIGNYVIIDSDAAGFGWFVDPTPGDDSEFTAPGDQGEVGRMDLLTVLAHEFGHVLGFEHADDGVMIEALGPGTRIDPTSEEAAAVASIGDRPAAAAPAHPARRAAAPVWLDDVAAVVPAGQATAAAVAVHVGPAAANHTLPGDDPPSWLWVVGSRKRKAFLTSWTHPIGPEDVGPATI